MVQKGGEGFTLLEILIVLVIILLLGTIAIPRLLEVRVQSKEDAIQQILRSLSSANENYRALQVPPTYAATLEVLKEKKLDAAVPPMEAAKLGYRLTYVHPDSTAKTYALTASPVEDRDGAFTYCVDQTGLVSGGRSGVHGTPEGCEGGAPLAR